MRVEGTHIGQIAGRAEARPAGAESSRKSEASGNAVVVQIGSAAADAAQAADNVNQQVSARIAEISAQLERGTYKLDLDTLAERIVDDELSRGGR